VKFKGILLWIAMEHRANLEGMWWLKWLFPMGDLTVSQQLRVRSLPFMAAVYRIRIYIGSRRSKKELKGRGKTADKRLIITGYA
jgi:hypothetical protein